MPSLERQQNRDQASSILHMASLCFLGSCQLKRGGEQPLLLVLTPTNEHAGMPEQHTPITSVQALSACEGCRRCHGMHPAAVQAVKMCAQQEWAQA